MKNHNIFMKLRISLFFCILLILFTHPSLAKEEENAGNWFFFDRALPSDSIPVSSFMIAVNQQWDARQSIGFGLSPLNSTWTCIGPSNDYYNGRVVRVKYDPGDPSGNTVYICGHNGGVWRSDNAQRNPSSTVSFECKTMDLQTQSSGDIAIDHDVTHDILYYGTGGNVFCFQYNFYGIGVYKSTNHGDNWTGPYKTGLPGAIFTSTIAVNPTTHDVFLANGSNSGPYGTGSGGGLYKSSDGGVSWTKILPTTYSEPCYDVVFSNNGQYVYAVTTNGYWRSNNYGSSFQRIDPEGSNLYVTGRSQLAVSKANDQYVYAIVADLLNGKNYSYVSSNGGAGFSRHEFGNNNCMSLDFIFVQSSPVSATSGLVAYFGFGSRGGDSFFRTTDGGQNYEHINPNGAGGDGADMNNFAFNPLDLNQGLLCDDKGLFISNNILATSTSVSFTSLNYSLTLRENYRVATNPNDANDMVIAMEDAGFYKYLGGVLWNETSSGCDGTNVIHSRMSSPDVFLASKGIDRLCYDYVNDRTFGSNNGGSGWQYAPALTWSLWDGNLDWIAAFAESPTAPGTFYHPRRNGTNNSQIDINTSTNNGQTWLDPAQYTIPKILNTGDGNYSPQSISISVSNPNVIYVSTKRWLVNPPPLSQLWFTSNGGTNWYNRDITDNGVPNRVVTSVLADPLHENIVYLTLSGFGVNTTGQPGHVFESFDYGANWIDISTIPSNSFHLPDIPVNYITLRYYNNNQEKELFVGTDAGVYHLLEGPLQSYQWTELASALPNTVCLGLDYNLPANKLRAALFGRGIWEVALNNGIYIADNHVFSNSPISGVLDIGDSIIVLSGGNLVIPDNCTVRMPQNKKIIIQDGGQITCSSGNPVTFTSQSGTWGGIEFQGNSTSTLSNCTFQNTATPITIDNANAMNMGHIEIDNCTFTNCGPVSVNRSNVTVSGCTWNYSSAITGDVCGVSVTGSGSVIVQGNTINYAASSNHITGISVVQSSTTSVTSNIIRNASIGIFASNSDPSIRFNNIGVNGSTSADVGIGLDNCPNGYVLYDTIDSYATGISLLNGSSAVLHDNKVTNTSQYAMYCNNSANPRLTPTVEGGIIYWDAGLNILKSTTNSGDGIWLCNYSTPVLAEGYNTIWGSNCYLNGSGSGKWAVTNNCWVDDPPNGSKYCVTGFSRLTTTPYSCTPPAGAAGLSSENPEPPQPLVVYYGNGVYDTLKASNNNLVLNADITLYYQGVKKALQSDFTGAINTFKQVVQSYPDSTSAVESLKKLYYCYGRMNADTTAYTDLRSYYLGLSSQDTAFSKTATELSRKCLVRKLELEHAITEYEDVVQHSTTHTDSVSAEINIIEVYMLMQSHGGLGRFTGRLGYLKPNNTMEGLRMIKDKLYNLGSLINHIDIPKTFSLSQNYPNPFNPTTKIKYALPNAVKVTVKVYDILGRLVATLVNNEFKDAGFYEITFDGSNLASGVYFYNIEAGKFVQSKKMVVLK